MRHSATWVLSQFELAKYQAAAKTFRKALDLRPEDADLLAWLGKAFEELADWGAAEPLMRQALAVEEKSFGSEHPNVAAGLQQPGRGASENEPPRRGRAANAPSSGH